MLGVGLHARADAAPEGIEGQGPFARGPAHERDHVRESAVARPLVRQHVIEVRAIVIVEVRRVRLGRVELPRQLQHVVGVAALAGLLRDVARERAGLLEILAVAVAADHVSAVVSHRVPEEPGTAEFPRVVREFGVTGEPDQLRNLRVRVQEGELVTPVDQRGEDRLMVEALREPEPAPLAGPVGQLGEYLAHAAELGAEHRLHLRRIEAGKRALDEGRERFGDREGVLARAVARWRRAGRQTACASCRTAPSSRSGRSARSGFPHGRSPP